MIAIRRAKYDDIPGIMQFMDEHWKPGNVLAKNRDFFEWQFVDGDKLNMFLGVDEKSGKIYGMLGAIVYNKSSNPDVSGCTWQVIKSSDPMLGPKLLEYMYIQLNVRYSYAAGLTDNAVKLNKLVGNVITEMDHYYRLSDKSDYNIAKVVEKKIPVAEKTGYSLERISSAAEMKEVISEKMLAEQLMSKSYDYIEKRYFNHPIYHYDIWKIIDSSGDSHSVLITREEVMKEYKMCKIVDHYGRMGDLGEIAMALDGLMNEKGYEYIDIYSFGIPVEIYEGGGFIRCDTNSENIIPNYFHPYVQKNIPLRLVDSKIEGVRLFRGDGDQDRPC